MAEALDVGELGERGMLAEYQDETFGRVRSVALPLHVGGFEPTYRPGPSLGQDTDAILAELGFAPADVTRLRRAGAFGEVQAVPGDPSAP
jgi:crotonobetainyl-CoA:carnitine CoA-transferase CaiB-like acyl-CoA transferase